MAATTGMPAGMAGITCATAATGDGVGTIIAPAAAGAGANGTLSETLWEPLLREHGIHRIQMSWRDYQIKQEPSGNQDEECR